MKSNLAIKNSTNDIAQQDKLRIERLKAISNSIDKNEINLIKVLKQLLNEDNKKK